MKPDIAQLVNVLIKSDKGKKIEKTLLDLGVAPCVAREWANEPRRRKALAKRPTRQDRRDLSNCGRKGQPFRRIIRTEFTEDQDCIYYIQSGRERQFHATKGWRSYRKMT